MGVGGGGLENFGNVPITKVNGVRFYLTFLWWERSSALKGETEIIFSYSGQIRFIPVRHDMRMHILLTVLYTFLMELVGRICLNIKTSYPW